MSLPVRLRPSLLLASLLLVASPAAAAAGTEQLAIVIGNNVAAGRAPLRYADDDAIAMHRLLLEASVKSYLLVSPDADTRGLSPGVAVAGPPRWTDLERTVGTVAGAIEGARRQGRAAEVIFYYSGHGDVAEGEGYLALEDRRLTRSLLFDAVLARLPARRRHVFVDACKSYYLAAPRGPGGSRTTVAGGFLGTRRAWLVEGTGFVLSTSAARDSHEWERYQGGVFSHQLRSALRAAADVDADGRISYGEAGAFLRATSHGIPNPLFRPDFTLRAPGPGRGDLSLPLLAWPSRPLATGPTRLVLDREETGHLLVENVSGIRLADVPPARGAVRSILIPPERPLYVRRAGANVEYVVEGRGDARLSQLRSGPVQVALKGALHLALERLFSAPFGKTDVDDYCSRFSEAPIEALVERDSALGEDARQRRWRRWAGAAALSSAVLGLTLGGIAIERYASGRDASQVERDQRNAVIRGLGVTSGVLGAVAAGAGITWIVLTMRGREGTAVSVAPGLPAGAPGAVLSIQGW